MEYLISSSAPRAELLTRKLPGTPSEGEGRRGRWEEEEREGE